MFNFMRFFSLFLLFLVGASLAVARPDVGFSDTSAYLDTPHNPENAREIKFEIAGGPIAGITLPTTYYNLEALRVFAAQYRFREEAVGEEIKFSLGSPGEEFGHSFSSVHTSRKFLEALKKMLEDFDRRPCN